MTYDVNTMLPGGVVVLGVQVMQQLVAAGNGDAALLYMSLLGGGDVAPLQWEPARRAKAEEKPQASKRRTFWFQSMGSRKGWKGILQCTKVF